FFSISSICCFSAAGSKTPPGFLDPSAECQQFLFKFAQHACILPRSSCLDDQAPPLFFLQDRDGKGAVNGVLVEADAIIGVGDPVKVLLQPAEGPLGKSRALERVF